MHCTACECWKENVLYFDSFVVNKIIKFTRNKHIKRNFYRIQAYDSIMCVYFCVGFIDFMLKDKSLLENTNLFSLNQYKNNDK